MNELTRAELIDKICLADAIDDCGQVGCSSSCDKCEDVLNYLLDRYDAKVRAKVLEELWQTLCKYKQDINDANYGFNFVEIAFNEVKNKYTK